MIMYDQRKFYRIAHFPDYHKSNPYQNLLLSNLSTLGVDAGYGKDKIYFSNIDISIIYNLIKNKNFDIFHLHWQHPYLLHDNILIMVFRSFLFVMQLVLLKCLKVKIVWTVHNLKNHENKFDRTELYFSRIIAILADAIIAHCKTSKNEIVKLFRIKKNKVHIIEHGNYVNVYKERHTRKQSREILKIKDTEFAYLFIGLIRPYKGIVNLIESFKKINDPSAKLIIAGRIEDKEHADMLIKKAYGQKGIDLNLHYIDNDEIEVYLKAADVLVLPYRDIINSGSAILGMSFGKTIIAPRLGCISEILKSKGGILYEANDKNGLYKAMKTVIAARENLEVMGKDNFDLAKKWTWQRIAASTSDLYFQCLGK